MPQLANPIKPAQPPRLDQLNHRALVAYFESTWQLYELLFSAIQTEQAYYLAPDPLRNPLIFYLGHTAAFYINKLKMAGLIEQGVDDRLDQLLAVGVDPALPEELKSALQWPSLAEVRAYRDTIFPIVREVILKADLQQPVRPESPLWALFMGLEHSRIHFETSSVLIRQLDAALLKCPPEWSYAPTKGMAPPLEWAAAEGGPIQLGKPADDALFGWDNEYGQLSVEVAPFLVTKRLITNEEYLDFFQSGSYNAPQYWSAEGWAWKERTRTQHPKFWIPAAAGFRYRALFDELDMPLDWPVEVNAYEAAAYCTWQGNDTRLLTEAEFCYLARLDKPASYDPALALDHNLHFSFGSPSPVGIADRQAQPLGITDLYGNVWDLLSDDFYALPGFEVHPYYADFSAPYMDAEHGMMAGGSWATTGTSASKYYRLWFRRYFYQHAGFRLAKSI